MKRPKTEDYINLFLKSFLKGLIIVGPIAATLYIIFVVFDTLDNIVPFGFFLPDEWNRTGLGFITLIAFITTVGYFFNKFVLLHYKHL